MSSRMLLLAIAAQALAMPLAAAGQARPADLKALPANTWVVVEDATDGGTAAGIVYLPEQKGMFLWGIRRRKDWRGRVLSKRYWTELFRAETGKWEEWVPAAGRLEAGLGRGSYYTQWARKGGYDMPALPYHNVGFWHAHQFCTLPEEKKLLYFLGGATFTYDPATRTFENKKIPFGKAPPDVMLGSMVWDPVNKEAILFGGGYLRAYQAKPGDVRQSRPPDAWTPERWDRRGTWAYSPRENRWRKLVTASKAVVEQHRVLANLRRELIASLGTARRVTLGFRDARTTRSWDWMFVPSPGAFSEYGEEIRGGGDDEYEKRQFSTAATILVSGLAPALREAEQAEGARDGWRTLHALEAARTQFIEAEEAVAPAPRPRHYSRMVYDPKHKKIVLFGGDGEDRYFADTWLFDCAKRRWERCRPKVHPPPSRFGMVAMDYDAKNEVVVLAQQTGEVWAFDTAKREWRRVEVALGGFGRKGWPPTGWISMDYDPVHDVHVVLDMVGESRRTLLLRLDATKVAEAKPGGPEEVWRDDRYQRAWSHLPKTQAEYRRRVAEHRKRLAAVPPNTWTELKAPYSGWGRAYGSFCYDWDRDQIVLWGGGHSAYMGNEVSQYDLKSNLWMESWNPEFPPYPYRRPDGPGWHPSFTHEKGTHHGYHHYVYCSDLRRIVFFGGTLQYDPDRMRYVGKRLRKVGEGGLGMAVEMNGSPGLLNVSARHWYGQPFGVWQADFQAKTLRRIPGSDTPFGTNDRAKIVFDTARKRILFYGARESKKKGKCNQLWAFRLDTRKWEHIIPRTQPEGEEPPQIEQWNYSYSATHDGLLIAAKQATWVYDCTANLLKRVAPGIDTPGVVYAPRHDLFYGLCGGGYKPQRLFVFRLAAKKESR